MSGFQGPSGVKVNRRGGSTRQTFPFVPLIASQPVDLDPLPDNATPTQLAPPELPDRSTVSHNNEMAVHSPGIGSPHALFTTPTPAVRYPSPSYQKIPESPSFIYEPSVPSTAQPSPGRDLSHERGRTASKSRNKEKKCRNKKSAASKGVIAKVEELRTNQHLRDFPWKRFKGKFHAAVADTCIIELVDHLLDLCESKDSELQQLRETVNSLQEQSSSAPPRGNEISTDEPEIASADLADHSARSNIQLGSVDSSQDQAMSPPHLFGGMESATPADNFSELSNPYSNFSMPPPPSRPRGQYEANFDSSMSGTSEAYVHDWEAEPPTPRASTSQLNYPSLVPQFPEGSQAMEWSQTGSILEIRRDTTYEYLLPSTGTWSEDYERPLIIPRSPRLSPLLPRRSSNGVPDHSSGSLWGHD